MIQENKEELIEMLRDAQSKLYEVIEILDGVADETEDGHARAYLIDHLKIMAGEGHGFLSRDFNLDKWVEQLEEEDGDEENDE